MNAPIPLVVFAALHLCGAFYAAGHLVHFAHNDVSEPATRDTADVGLIRMDVGDHGVLDVEGALRASAERDGSVLLYTSWTDVPKALATEITAHASLVLVNYALDVADPRPAPPGMDKRRMSASQWELAQAALHTVRMTVVAGRTADDVAAAPLPGDKFDAFDYTFICVREPWADRREWPKRWMLVDKNGAMATIPLTAWTALIRSAVPGTIRPV